MICSYTIIGFASISAKTFDVFLESFTVCTTQFCCTIAVAKTCMLKMYSEYATNSRFFICCAGLWTYLYAAIAKNSQDFGRRVHTHSSQQEDGDTKIGREKKKKK